MTETIEINGDVAPGFEAVKDAFAKNFADGYEVGASVAVYRDGAPIVDLWGGWFDQAKTQLWQRDTLVNVFSSTKGPMALAVAKLVDRDQLSYSDAVSQHWPEFAANGKEAITVGQMMSHQGGLCGLREPITVNHYEDWDFMAQSLAAMEPFWTLDGTSGYHAITYGFLAGELLRRVDGRTPGKFIAEEICKPLEADFHVGLADSEHGRVSPIIAADNAGPLTSSKSPESAIAALSNPTLRPTEVNEPDWRRAEMPAVNGHGNAKALARIYRPLSMGGNGIIGEEALDAATTRQCFGVDRNLGYEMDWGCGFLRNSHGAYGTNPETFGHTGWGGSMGFADRKNRLAVGYAMNKMDASLQGNPRTLALVAAIYSSL